MNSHVKEDQVIDMATPPVEITLQLKPTSRVDIIDVSRQIRQKIGDIFYEYRKAFYCSFHTTAGYFEQSLCARLHYNKDHVHPFINVFRKLFPPGADYRHDQLQLRTELTEAQRQNEPKNADSHLIFISSGLKSCVTYANEPDLPVYFIDLDGVNGALSRNRRTTAVAYDREVTVFKTEMKIPVSRHRMDSINLKDPKIGFMDELNYLLEKHDVEKGKVEVTLAQSEKHAGLTVNEYETLLMRHDLAEVLRNPFKFMALQSKHALLDPKAIPGKTIDYAKYDMVHLFNELIDAFGISESVLEKILAKFIALPASRFLRMKRGVSLFASDWNADGKSEVVHGTYQSPILVQWKPVSNQVRNLDVKITKFE